MHRRTLYESDKIKVPDIDMLCVASMHHIDISMNRYTPRSDVVVHRHYSVSAEETEACGSNEQTLMK